MGAYYIIGTEGMGRKKCGIMRPLQKPFVVVVCTFMLETHMKALFRHIRKDRDAMLLFGVVLFSIAVNGQQVEQTVTLSNGWNAVYVSVAPAASTDDLFASWPVWSVSAYNAQSFLSTVSTAGGKTGESVVNAPYWIWSREAPQASTLKALLADTVIWCYATNRTPFTVTLRGEPAAPRIAWHATEANSTQSLNIFGLRLGGRVKLNDWLAGSPAVANGTIYRIAGINDASPTFVPLNGFSNKPIYVNDGDVVFVPGAEVSDWSGPLYIMPRVGLNFGTEGMLDEMSIRNDGAAEKMVSISYIDSVDGIVRPELLFRESYGETATAEWRPLTNTLTRALATGETWKVALALDRSKLSNTEAAIGGILRIEETGGTLTRAWLPVAAKDVKPLSVWPQGLWVANLTLSKVSFYKADAKRTDGVPAGGRMKLKVYVRMEADGSAHLLQRVMVKGTRLSSAALPVDLPDTPAASGTFGATDSPLTFNYTIGATSPSNPFRHALHPLFDNKQMDFKTPAPDGDDPANYVGSVKPESFSIGGRVEFLFNEAAATAWTPVEKLSGSCKWIYTGVRRDGPVVAEGTFTMQRIAVGD